MDGQSLIKTNINFVYEFKTPNGFLPLGYNKYSFPINAFDSIETIRDEDYVIIVNSSNDPAVYHKRNSSYPIKLYERGRNLNHILVNDLNEETINTNDVYLLCFESFSTQVLFEYYSNENNKIENMISSKLLNLVKKYPNFKIMFVDIWEGSYEHNIEFFKKLNEFLDRNNISDVNKIIISTVNGLIEKVDNNILNPSGTQRINTFCNDSYINESGKFISELRATKNKEIVSKEYIYSLQSELKLEKKPKKFLMYNRNTSRLHRPWFVKLLFENNLLDSGYVSLIKNEEFEEYIKKSNESVSELDLIESDFNNLKNSYKEYYPLTIDEEDGDTIAWFHNYLSRKKEYEETFFSIVGETNAEKNYLFITEKTTKPIMNLHPFFIVGSPYSLKYLQNMGFKTFSEFWDESYDTETNFKIRCNMIINEVKKLCNKSQEELIEMIKNMEDILIFNKKLLHSFYNNNRSENMFRNNLIDLI
jgi:hypothetical protein